MSKKKILHIIPYYDFFPPKNGGALRCYHINQQLAKYFDVTLLTYQNKELLTNKSGYEWNKTINILNPDKHINLHGVQNKIINALKYRFYKRQIHGPAELSFLMFYKVLRKLLKTQHFDAVLFEHLMSYELAPILNRFSPNTVQIINQHNVDHVLYEQENDISDPFYHKKYKNIKHSESNLYKTVNEIICCSENDKKILADINKNKVNVTVIPNGTIIPDTRTQHATKSPSNIIIFCGALNYHPNIEGLIWFLDNVWPQLIVNLPNVQFKIIGRGSSEKLINKISHPNIRLIGEVESVKPYYLEATIAIVPLLTGSGTRLKVLEAMGFGLPMVSTSKGAEGIKYTENKNILIANEPTDFYAKMVQLIQDIGIWSELSKNSKELVKNNYTWDVVGLKLKETINNATGQTTC